MNALSGEVAWNLAGKKKLLPLQQKLQTEQIPSALCLDEINFTIFYKKILKKLYRMPIYKNWQNRYYIHTLKSITYRRNETVKKRIQTEEVNYAADECEV